MEKDPKELAQSDGVEKGPSTSKSSRWIGIIAIALFFILGGYKSYPWYMWIVLAILGLFTFGGAMKWGQLILGAVLLIWGTPEFRENSDAQSNQQYQSVTSTSDKEQSEQERQLIEGKIRLIESLKSQFDRADRMGAPDYELKRISDEAWSIQESLQEMNLTQEQRVRISNLFS